MPAARPDGTVNVIRNEDVVTFPNVPVLLTVTVVALRVGMLMTVVPLSICADTALEVPGVKPKPAIPTAAPLTTCPAPKAMVGETRTVRVADAVLPAASVTVTVMGPEAVVEEINVPMLVPLAATLPLVSVVGAVVSADAGVFAVLYQVVATPFNVRVSVDDAANPVPVIVTALPALRAVGVKVIVGLMVKLAVAEAPVPDVTVIVCVPAIALVTGIRSGDKIEPV